jgi:hypothetical protein
VPTGIWLADIPGDEEESKQEVKFMVVGLTKRGKMKKYVSAWLEKHKEIVPRWVMENHVVPLVLSDSDSLPTLLLNGLPMFLRGMKFSQDAAHLVFDTKNETANPITIDSLELVIGRYHKDYLADYDVAGRSVPAGAGFTVTCSFTGKEFRGLLTMVGFEKE